MARSISDIYNQLIEIKNGASELNDLTPATNYAELLNELNSGSKVAVWRLWIYITAVGIWLNEIYIDAHLDEINSLIRTRLYGTLQWYHSICFDFQYGHALVWNGQQYIYSDTTSTEALESRIIKRAAVVKAVGQLQFKVAKLDAENVPIPLNEAEKEAFQAYLNDLAYAGTNCVVISQGPDSIKLNFQVLRDPLVLNSQGGLLSNPASSPVIAAIEGYLRNLPFNGVMRLSELIDAVQAVSGVRDVVLFSAQARYGDLPWQSIVRDYTPFAGHMSLDLQQSTIAYPSV